MGAKITAMLLLLWSRDVFELLIQKIISYYRKAIKLAAADRYRTELIHFEPGFRHYITMNHHLREVSDEIPTYVGTIPRKKGDQKEHSWDVKDLQAPWNDRLITFEIPTIPWQLMRA